MAFTQQLLSFLLCLTLVFTTVPWEAEGAASQEQYAPLSPDGLDAMVAPIALYPDELAAQVLAATYPDEITEANDWLNANSSLQGQALMQAADQQDWDDAVKAITLFPSVLAMLANKAIAGVSQAEDRVRIQADEDRDFSGVAASVDSSPVIRRALRLKVRYKKPH